MAAIPTHCSKPWETPLSPSKSSDEERPTAQLAVTAGSPFAEIFLLDQHPAMVDRSVGDYRGELPAGVYKVKARLADATAERLILLEDDESLDISGDLVVRSSVPLADSRAGREQHLPPFVQKRGTAKMSDRA